MAGLFGLGRETAELKKRMRKIIEAEQATVKALKSLEKSVNEHKEVMEKVLAKL